MSTIDDIRGLKVNSILLVFYVFQAPYVHHQEEYIVHGALFGVLSMRLWKQSTRYCAHPSTWETACINVWNTHHLAACAM